MNEYLSDTRYAAEAIINAYNTDFERLFAKIRDFGTAHAIFSESDTTLTFPAELAQVSRFCEAYKIAHQQAQTINESVQALINRAEATAALCGALLQLAKQGISVANGGFNGPPGRAIGTQPLRDVIRHTRNQAFHWEEGRLTPNTLLCFQAFDADFGLVYTRDCTHRSLATEVIDVLGWHSYTAYETDMLSLAPRP